MDIWVNLLLLVHFIALVVGGATSVGMPIIGSKMPTATPETRVTLFAIASRLGSNGRIAMVVLLISGPLLLWLKWDGNVPNVWFWVKMALVVVMLVGIVVAGINFKKAQQGDRAASRTGAIAGRITGLAFLGVVLSAVLAFN